MQVVGQMLGMKVARTRYNMEDYFERASCMANVGYEGSQDVQLQEMVAYLSVMYHFDSYFLY